MHLKSIYIGQVSAEPLPTVGMPGVEIGILGRPPEPFITVDAFTPSSTRGEWDGFREDSF